MVYRNEPGRVPKDSRAKFAELLRRAERNGERIRLTRSGVPFAYIVPLQDGERLKRFDEMSRRMNEQQSAGGPPQGYAPEPQFPPPPQGPPPGPPPSPYDSAFPEHGDENERQIAINTFKKSIERILNESEPISRTEISRRIKHDGYIATAVRKIIGEG